MYLKSCMADLEDGRPISVLGSLPDCNNPNDMVETPAPVDPTVATTPADCHNVCQLELENSPDYPNTTAADDDIFRDTCITSCEAMHGMPMDTTVGVTCYGTECEMPAPTMDGMDGTMPVNTTTMVLEPRGYT